MQNVNIDRRTALVAAASFVLSRRVSAADTEHALFWTVTLPGRKSAVVFGYERIAATLVPDIVKDGDALVAASQRVVIDMPQNIRFPALPGAPSKMKPILQAISPRVADRLRKLFATTPGASIVDRLNGLAISILLSGEGQHSSQIGTVGGAIFDYARSRGKPIDQLLSDAEVRSAYQPADMAALENSVSTDTISYLLDLRDRVGPIGDYLETLYRQRKAEEIVRVGTDMTRHGVFAPSQLLQTDRIRDMLFEHALSMLTQQADVERFMFFPLGILAGPTGLLATLKMQGAAVAPRA